MVDEDEQALAPIALEPEKPQLDNHLNPLVQAALVERLQYDEDIPELRTGPIPFGVPPAMSVDTLTPSLAAIGHMMNLATEIVAGLLPEGGYLECKDGDETALVQVSKDQDIDLYKRGAVPAPMAVPEPTGTDLAGLDFEQTQALTRKALVTTQGRRSVTRPIEHYTVQALEAVGVNVQLQARAGTHTKFVWSIRIPENGEINPHFDFVWVASAALAKSILKYLDGGKDVCLYFQPHNAISQRAVGWEVLVSRP